MSPHLNEVKILHKTMIKGTKKISKYFYVGDFTIEFNMKTNLRHCLSFLLFLISYAVIALPEWSLGW